MIRFIALYSTKIRDCLVAIFNLIERFCCGAGDSMFDASQYAFFGNDVVEEVELGGLEEEEDVILSFNVIREGFSFDKEEVSLTLLWKR